MVYRGSKELRLERQGVFFIVLALAITATFAGAQSLKGVGELRYKVRFQGRTYETIYKREMDKGVPIDLFYDEIQPHGRSLQRWEKR